MYSVSPISVSLSINLGMTYERPIESVLIFHVSVGSLKCTHTVDQYEQHNTSFNDTSRCTIERHTKIHVSFRQT